MLKVITKGQAKRFGNKLKEKLMALYVLLELEEAGIEVIELSDEERGKFREASRPIYETMDMPEGALEAWNTAVGR